jgi:sulfite exporter TauE/SafE
VLDLVLPLASVLPHSAGPYIALILIGFVVGIFGHLSTARWLVAAGVILIFLGALLFPLALNLTEEAPPRIEAPDAGPRELETLR